MGFSFGRMVEFFRVLQNSVKKFLRSPQFGLSIVLATLAISLTFFFSAVAVADHDVMIETIAEGPGPNGEWYLGDEGTFTLQITNMGDSIDTPGETIIITYNDIPDWFDITLLAGSDWNCRVNKGPTYSISCEYTGPPVPKGLSIPPLAISFAFKAEAQDYGEFLNCAEVELIGATDIDLSNNESCTLVTVKLGKFPSGSSGGVVAGDYWLTLTKEKEEDENSEEEIQAMKGQFSRYGYNSAQTGKARGTTVDEAADGDKKTEIINADIWDRPVSFVISDPELAKKFHEAGVQTVGQMAVLTPAKKKAIGKKAGISVAEMNGLIRDAKRILKGSRYEKEPGGIEVEDDGERGVWKAPAGIAGIEVEDDGDLVDPGWHGADTAFRTRTMVQIKAVPQSKENLELGQWTPWLNRDTPGGKGDYETIKDFLAAGQIEPDPSGIDCTTINGGIGWAEAGQVYSCNLETGGVCINAEQQDGKCLDYQVRFLYK